MYVLAVISIAQRASQKAMENLFRMSQDTAR
jgi:hypothetical protein